MLGKCLFFMPLATHMWRCVYVLMNQPPSHFKISVFFLFIGNIIIFIAIIFKIENIYWNSFIHPIDIGLP